MTEGIFNCKESFRPSKSNALLEVINISSKPFAGAWNTEMSLTGTPAVSLLKAGCNDFLTLKRQIEIPENSFELII